MKKYLIAGVVSLIALFVGVFFTNDTIPTGGASGQDHYNLERFLGGQTVGGCITATSTTAAVGTLRTSEFQNCSVIDYTVNVADVTLTLAASTSPAYPTLPGETRTIFIRNASTTATADLTIAAGTGVLLKKATTTAVIYGDTDGANFAKLVFTRKANKDIEALLNIYMD